MDRISRSTAKAAAVLVAIAACGQAEGNRTSTVEGDIRGVEELARPDLSALAAGEATFVVATGVMNVSPATAGETLLIMSKRASDGAVLVNGQAVVDSLKTTVALSTAVKRINVTVGQNNTTVIFDYYNGTFAAGTAPVSPAHFSTTAGSVVAFGSKTGGAFKVRGSTGADTIYAGQDVASGTPAVLVSFTGTTPDVEVTAAAGNIPSLGFSLGAGNDTFDATNAKGATSLALTFPVDVHGGAGNDTIIGGTGADTIYGDEGLNTIDESSGSATSHTADTVYGLTTATTVVGINTTTVTYANWAKATGVTVQIAHLATGLIGGVTDNIDDSVAVVIGSPVADHMTCSQLTDVPCMLEGGAGDDTLSPGLSATNTEYLFGGDGNDTFAMNHIASKVALIGGNIGDISTTKNLYVDTVDYSGALSSSVATTISMNGTGPATCNLATAPTPAAGAPPCPGTADATHSGLFGSANTDIRNDITGAKCPTGALSASVVCTVKGNNNGNVITSGWGADLLTGGTGDDTFVVSDFTTGNHYTAATATKVITGNGGNDTADFSAHLTPTTVHLDCAVGTCANSGNVSAQTAADATAATTAATAAGLSTTALSTLTAAYGLLSSPNPTADDTAEETAAIAANTAAQAVSTALATAVANNGSAADATAVTAALATLTTANTALATAISNYDGAATPPDDSGIHTDAQAVATQTAAVAAAAATFTVVSEGISLVNINNAVCPTTASTACVVISNGNADEVDFSGNGGTAGSSLTCNSSSVVTLNASGLTPNCGL